MAEHSHRMEHCHGRDDKEAGEIIETSVVEKTHDHDGGEMPHHHARPDELNRKPEEKPKEQRSLWAWSGEE